MRAMTAVLAALMAAAVVPARAGEWMQFRGPGGLGISDEKSTPVTWAAGENIAWQVDLPGPGSSSPIVVGDRVFITCYTGYGLAPNEGDQKDLRRHLLCIDRASGKELWQKPGAAVQPMFHTAMSPLVDGGMMILHVGGHNDGALTAFDPATGAVKWTWTGDGPAYGSPIIADLGGPRQVIVFSQKSLVGVDAANGQLLWSVPFEARSTTNSITPLVYGNHLYVLGNSGLLRCFEAKTGKQLYSERVGGSSGYTASLVAADGRLYCVSESHGVRVVKAGPEFELLAVNPIGETCMATPAISDGTLLLRTERHLVALGLPRPVGTR